MSLEQGSKESSFDYSRGNERPSSGQNNMMASVNTSVRSRKSKRSRPCDGCALRKIKCSDSRPCTRCLNNGIPCTNNRIRKKCGPKSKKLQDPQYFPVEPIQFFAGTTTPIDKIPNNTEYLPFVGTELPPTTSSNFFGPSRPVTKELIPMNILLPCLQVYQTWYYSLWPVLSVTHLVTKLSTIPPGEQLNDETSISYALCLAVCAAISKQIAFISENSNIIKLPSGVQARDYALAALRIRNEYEHPLNPTSETLLTSFFLYVYYINNKGGTAAAIMYLREAISMAQIMHLQDADTYMGKPPAEVHRLRKIYYLLLVTERYMCIQDGVPVILDSSIPFPMSDGEEYSDLLTGFTELVKIFSIPDRLFFEKMSASHSNNTFGGNFDNLKNFFHLPINNITEGWVVDVDNRIKGISITTKASDIQKVNLLLSKHWMRSLVWHISFQNGLLSINREENDCLSVRYPVAIAYEFLTSTSNLPMYAFESNGPGVVVKLLEIANGLADTMNDLTYIRNGVDTFACSNALTSIFWLISKFKTDVTLPLNLYNKIEGIVNASPIPRMRFSPVSSPELEGVLEEEIAKITSDVSSSSESSEEALGIVAWT
ncbi:hypothetical protein G9P44_002376 [Scheffersomyces stipitis]|nr:hypothetical protein G9P44_002376 [Scheffersomyces stipitis]